ncbi:NACHT domain-containing protein [Streptomyces platensis]|uniref:NACHT domain-containing protein n=1 Tax=Streptomyces platensis TaxID=58346 RepID=UPI002ED2290E|nr:NACHT domain-containing protein [Streptomyces platensis]
MGRQYLLLMVLGAAGALALTRHFDLGTAATAATLLPTLAPAYLTWKAFQHDRAEATAVDLEKVASQLAQAVKKQWDDEAAIRRLNDPYPLPVAWRAADADLVEPWPRLAELARAWPGGPPGDPGRWSADATGMEGADAQIGEVFAERVPTRRLVVLGEPGSGKTMLLIRLLQDLIERRKGDGLVPVLFSLASWDPAHQRLEDWLAEQLRRGHPGLRAPAPVAAPRAGQEVDLAQALLDTRRILPLLDGFDELPPALHTLALDALNRALPAKQPLVVASRTAAYHAALNRPGAMVRLNGAAGIHLLPLTADQIAAYLRRDAGGLHTPAADRWNTVITHLGADTPVGQALSTPLGLFLARTIYNPRPHRHATSGLASRPDELFNTAAFPTRAALDTHLFNAFIPAVYTPHQPNPPRWPAHQAHRALVFLARHLEARHRGSPDMAWWELAYTFPIYIRHLVLGPVFGLVFGLAGGFVFGFSDGLVDGPAHGFAYGLMGGLADGPAVWLTVGIAVLLIGRDVRRRAPSTRLHWWSSSSLAIGLVFGLAAGLAVWLAFRPLDWLGFESADGAAVGLARGLAVGFVWGLTSWLTFGLAFGLAAWLMGRHVRRSTPSTQLRWSSNSLVGWLAVGVVAGLAAGVVVGFTDGLSEGFTVGLAAGLMGWLGVGLMGPDARRSTPSTQLRLSPNSLAVGLTFGLGVGLIGGLAYGLAYGLAHGLVGALVLGLAAGLATEKPDLTITVGPVTLLTQDRRIFLTVTLAGGLAGGLMFGLSDGLAYGLPDGLAVGLAIGLAVGLAIGLGVGLKRTAWADFVVARAYLAVRHGLPWSLMAFLQDAHERRGVLRQVGAMYHFRHIDLQRHLAQQPWPPIT